jgi:peptidoglycan hydrolase-like protein with peptidoglycan-binding domain
MKFLLTICLFLISLPAIAAAQPRDGQSLLTRAQRLEAERGLSNLGYWTGPVDGVLDQATRSALISFQKWEGAAALPTARESGYEHVEVDLDRQVLLMVRENGSVRVLPVSTGNDKPFEDEGQMSIAYTPRGRFLVYEKVAGWEKGMLGSMYYSSYISGGVAIHGSPNVPTQPGSHGCIRVPMFAARELSKMLPVGTIVLVYDKVSFVSAKSWVKNPKLKQEALSRSTETDYTYVSDETKNNRRPVVIKQTRPRIIRARAVSEPPAAAGG